MDRVARAAEDGNYSLDEIVNLWLVALDRVAGRDGWIQRTGRIVTLKAKANDDAVSEAVHFHSEGDAELFEEWVLGKLRLENVDFEHLRRI